MKCDCGAEMELLEVEFDRVNNRPQWAHEEYECECGEVKILDWSETYGSRIR